MKNMFNSIFLTLGIAAGSVACNVKPVLTTVSSVDLNRYLGTWYELASYPQFFERGCTNVKATYTLKEGYVEVYNESLKDGKPNNIKGKAFVVPNTGNSKLKVHFFWPFKGNYWIIDLAPDYSWAIVSDPKLKTLWILSRNKTLDAALYNSLLEKLVIKGFERNKIIKMVQE